MPMPSTPPEEKAKRGILQTAKQWGESSLPPTLLATLISAQHLRPFQTLPMLFPPILLFASYLNLNGYATDAAGLTGAWSAAYLVLARRRRQGLSQKFGVRGFVRGGTMVVCLANMVGGGVAYAFGPGKKEV